MTQSTEKAKLLWRSNRGMLELDLILKPFAAHCLDSLTEAKLNLFSKLLDCNDPQLYSWLMGHEEPRDKELAQLVHTIRMQNYP